MKKKSKKRHPAKKAKTPKMKLTSNSTFLGNVLSFSWFKKAAR